MANNPRITVRLAKPSDIDQVAPLFDAYRQFYRHAPDLRAARDFLAARIARDESAVLLAHPVSPHDAPLVGFTQLYRTFSSVALGPVVVLNDLFVVPAWRGKGVARLLVDAAVAHARDAGALRIDLATEITNSRALQLYESMHFRRETGFLHLSLGLREPDA